MRESTTTQPCRLRNPSITKLARKPPPGDTADLSDVPPHSPLQAATTGRVCDVIVESAGIHAREYEEWCQKVGATADDATIANEKAAFDAQINAPINEITPLVARSNIVRELLENGVA